MRAHAQGDIQWKEGVRQVMKLAASDAVVPVLSLHKFG